MSTVTAIVVVAVSGWPVTVQFGQAIADYRAGRAALRWATLRSAQQAAGWAARVLPDEDRERYHAEFLGELEEQRSKRAQLLYVARLLTHAPALRFALRAAKQRERVR